MQRVAVEPRKQKIALDIAAIERDFLFVVPTEFLSVQRAYTVGRNVENANGSKEQTVSNADHCALVLRGVNK